MFAYPLTLKGEEAHNCAAGPGVGSVRPILALHHPYMDKTILSIPSGPGKGVPSPKLGQL